MVPIRHALGCLLGFCGTVLCTAPKKKKLHLCADPAAGKAPKKASKDHFFPYIDDDLNTTTMAPTIFVKIQYVGGGDIDLNVMLNAIFQVSQVTPTRYHPILNESGLKLILPKKEMLKQFCSPKAKEELTKKKFKVLETPATLAQKTLYIRHGPDCTWECQDRDADDVLNWINAKNNVQALSVYLPPVGKQWMKVTFNKVDDAESLKKSGIRLRHTMVLPSDIKFEEYVEVPQCNRCYSLAHSTTKCNKRKGYTLCSKCGQEGHLYMGCTNPERCHNCGGDHSAFSLTCADKKEAMKECRKSRARSSSAKRPRANQGQHGRTQNVSYATAAQRGTKTGQAPSGQPAGGARQQTGRAQGRSNSPQPGPSHIPDSFIPPQINPQL